MKRKEYYKPGSQLRPALRSLKTCRKTHSLKIHAGKTITSKTGQIKQTTMKKSSCKSKTKINRSEYKKVQRIRSKQKIQKETLKYIHSTSLQVLRQIFASIFLYKQHSHVFSMYLKWLASILREKSSTWNRKENMLCTILNWDWEDITSNQT